MPQEVEYIVPNDDFYVITHPDGTRTARLVQASDEEKREAEIDALRRELEGIEFRLEHLDDEPMPWQAIPVPAEVERTRSGWENTKAAVLARLAELEEPPPPPKRKR
jgi:hypothetical protein